MPIDKELWNSVRQRSTEHTPTGLQSTQSELRGVEQPIINLHVNTAPRSEQSQPSPADIVSNDRLSDLEERFDRILSRYETAGSPQPSQTTIPPIIINTTQGEEDSYPRRRIERSKKWPFVLGGVVLLLLTTYSCADDWREAGCEKVSDKFCYDSELSATDEQIEGVPVPQSGGRDETPVITAPDYVPDVETTAPRYIPPPGPMGGDGELAPGAPEDYSDRPMYLTQEGQQYYPQAQTNGVLNDTDQAYMLNQTEEGYFVEDEEVLLDWKIADQDPSGQLYEIILRQIENGRYLSDQSLGRYLNSNLITDTELMQFLFANNIIPSNVPMLYVEFVGESGGILRTLSIGGAG